MGEQEAGAFFSVAAALELAVAGGELRPGARGWRAAQQAVARRHLATPGQSWMGTAGSSWWRPSGSVSGRAAAARPVGRGSSRCFRVWLVDRCCRCRSRPARRGRQLAAPLRLLEVLGLCRAGGDWRTRWVALTEPGRALALEALRARAIGPRPDPRGP